MLQEVQHHGLEVFRALANVPSQQSGSDVIVHASFHYLKSFYDLVELHFGAEGDQVKRRLGEDVSDGLVSLELGVLTIHH